MTDAQILAGDLLANVAERTVSGKLLPFGEVGHTNLGKFQIDGPGIITLPKDFSTLQANENHSQLEPRARFSALREEPDGVYASFQIGTNPEDDALLAKIEEKRTAGTPMSLSVEVKNMVIKAGKAVSGLLTGAAFVERGAFASASLMAAAVDTEEDVDATNDHPFTDEQIAAAVALLTSASEPPQTTETAPVVTVTEREAPAAQNGVDMPEAVIPANLQAGQNVDAPVTKNAVYAMLAQAQATNDTALYAALSDIKISGTNQVGTAVVQPQWIGELWSGNAFQRKLVPLLNHADLTSLKISGFRWTVKPEVSTWAGNKAAVASNAPATAPYETFAERLAGAHDIAREFRDFNVEGFWESYFAAMTESYARKSEAGVAAALTTAGAYTPIVRGAVPTGVSTAAVAIVDGAIAIGEEGVPSFALIAPDLYREFLLTRNQDSLEFLDTNLSILTGGTTAGFSVQSSSALASGQVLVGSRNAATVYELPGSPIRVEGLDIARGGIDPAVFGYFGTVINNPAALALVAAAA